MDSVELAEATDPWEALDAELSRWARAGQGRAALWWRDDDATEMSEALECLLTLASTNQVEVALAVIPATASAGLAVGLQGTPVAVLQHGVRHLNRAPAAQKRSEFPAMLPVDQCVAEILAARAQLRARFGALTADVFVPPWNRLAPALLAPLATHFRAVSAFGEERLGSDSERPGTDVVATWPNTHVDVIDWRGGRGFVGERAALGQLVDILGRRRRDPQRCHWPIGLLTHHLVHDAATGAFLTRLLDQTRGDDRIEWLGLESVLARFQTSAVRREGQW